MSTFDTLVAEAKTCRICSGKMEPEPRPVFTIHPKAQVILIGQAPGTKVYESGIPWKDASGDRLRQWMGLTAEQFYNDPRIAIVPMGFCYPGKGKSGDLPPRSECAPAWHARMTAMMPHLKLYILIGQYAMKYYLKGKMKKNMTETIRAYREYEPTYFPLPHPSPRNIRWFMRNPWFDEEMLPLLRRRLTPIFASEGA